MGDFNTLTDISKHRRMFADDIARTDGGEANGAVRSALWLKEKKNGLFDMRDVLYLNNL